MNNFSSFQSQLFRGGVNPNSFSFVNKTAYGITLDPSGGLDYVSLQDESTDPVANTYQINRNDTTTFLVVDYSGAALRAADFLPTAQSNATIYVKYKHNGSTTNQSAFSHLFPSTFSHVDICGTYFYDTIETIEPGQSFDVKWLVAGADTISYAITGVADSVTLPKTGYLVNTYEKHTITLGSDASSGIIQFAVNDVSLATQVYVPYRYDVRTGTAYINGNYYSVIFVDDVANKTVLQYPGFHFFDVSGVSDFTNSSFDFYTGPNGSGSNYTVDTFETTSKYTALLVDQDTPNLYYFDTDLIGGAFLNLSKYDAKYSVKVVTNVVGQSVYAIDLCDNGIYYNQPDISFSSGNVYLFELDNSTNDPFNLVFGTTVDGAIDTTYTVTTMDASNKKVAMLDLAEYIGDSMVYFEQDVSGMGYIPPVSEEYFQDILSVADFSDNLFTDNENDWYTVGYKENTYDRNESTSTILNGTYVFRTDNDPNTRHPNGMIDSIDNWSRFAEYAEIWFPFLIRLESSQILFQSGQTFYPSDYTLYGIDAYDISHVLLDVSGLENTATYVDDVRAISSNIYFKKIHFVSHDNHTRINGWRINGYVIESTRLAASPSLTYTVSITGSSPAVFDICGTPQLQIDFASSTSYLFDQSDTTNAGQQIVFGYTPDNTTTLGVTDGVTIMGSPGQPGAYTQLDLSAGFVGPLYYYSDASANMGMDWVVNNTYNVTVQQNIVGQYVYAFDLCGNGTYYNQPDLSFASPYSYAFDVSDPSNNGYVLTFGTTVDVSSTVVDSEYVVREGTPGVDAGARVILNLVDYSGSALVYFEQDVSGMGYSGYDQGEAPIVSLDFSQETDYNNLTNQVDGTAYTSGTDFTHTGGLTLDSANGELQVAFQHDIVFNLPPAPFTIMLKHKYLTDYSYYQGTSFKQQGTGNYTVFMHQLYNNNTQYRLNSIKNIDGAAEQSVTPESDRPLYNLNQQYQYAYVKNDTELDLYVDGSLELSHSNSFTLESFSVNRESNDARFGTNIAIADFKIFDSAIDVPNYVEASAKIYITTVSGSPEIFYIDNSANPQIDFTANQSYIFDQSDPTNAGQQIVFGYTPDNTTTLGATDGVTIMGSPGQPGAYTQLDLSAGFVGPLYYYSDASANMGMDWIVDQAYNVTVNQNAVGQYVYAFDLCGNGAYYNQPDLSFVSPYMYKFDVSDASNNGYVLTFGTTVDVSSTVVASEYIMRNGTPGTAHASVILDLMNYSGSPLVYFEDSSAGMGYVGYEIVESVTVDQAEITAGNIDVSTVGDQSVITLKAPSDISNATYSHSVTFPSNMDISYVAVGAGGSGGRTLHYTNYDSGGGHGGFVIEGTYSLTQGTYSVNIPRYSEGVVVSPPFSYTTRVGYDGSACELQNSSGTTLIYSEGGYGSGSYHNPDTDGSRQYKDTYNSSFSFNGITYDRSSNNEGRGGYRYDSVGYHGYAGKTVTSIPGISSIVLGGGGGASGYYNDNSPTNPGNGGNGGGGPGCEYNSALISTNYGTNHKGGGGGGGSYFAGTTYSRGGSGVMYIWGNFSVGSPVVSYTVTVLNSDFYLSNVEKQQVNFTPGTSYIFDQSDPSNTGEQIVFGTSADSATLYTTGVTIVGSPGRPGAYTQIEVPSDFVGTLYYYSLNTTEMGYS